MMNKKTILITLYLVAAVCLLVSLYYRTSGKENEILKWISYGAFGVAVLFHWKTKKAD